VSIKRKLKSYRSGAEAKVSCTVLKERVGRWLPTRL